MFFFFPFHRNEALHAFYGVVIADGKSGIRLSYYLAPFLCYETWRILTEKLYGHLLNKALFMTVFVSLKYIIVVSLFFRNVFLFLDVWQPECLKC